ncbi:hypothetical protein ACFXGA_22750 [Actinosynnema sp. NPDC059335]|uniref:hypothetical protein n=1 Tax=Actinosynnema sp. NPDC059335 TaxID=3346804 RepID=UPI00366F70CF
MTTVWISGPRAVGKSTVAWEVYRRLVTTTKAGYLDVAQLTFATPPLDLPATARRLHAVRRVYLEEGAHHLVITGEHHPDLLPDANLCWLHATHDDLVTRLLLRGAGQGPAIPGDDLRGLPDEHLRHLANPTPPPPEAHLVLDTTAQTATNLATTIINHFFTT